MARHIGGYRDCKWWRTQIGAIHQFHASACQHFLGTKPLYTLMRLLRETGHNRTRLCACATIRLLPRHCAAPCGRDRENQYAPARPFAVARILRELSPAPVHRPAAPAGLPCHPPPNRSGESFRLSSRLSLGFLLSSLISTLCLDAVWQHARLEIAAFRPCHYDNIV